MTDAAHHDAVIERLAGNLEPVDRLPEPWVRAATWLGLAVAFGLALASFADLAETGRRLVAQPDMCLAGLGSTLTAVAAAWAAFATSVPGSARRWALAPIPPLLVWAGASGWGCLRTDFFPDTSVTRLAQTESCVVFILGVSVPLSAAIFLMMRHALSLQPGVTAALGGLASAAAAATLLTLIHPFDAAATDLLVHAAAIGVVVGTARLFGFRYAAGRPA